MIGDDTVRIDTAAPATRPAPPARTGRTYRARRKLEIGVEPRAAGVLGGWLHHDHQGEAFVWAPVPFLAVRWRGSLRGAGLLFGLAAVLSVMLGLPAPWNALLAAWLALPAGSALWHAWLSGRLL